ncbi:MAG: protein translocase subunit SecF, partial [Anaerolineae bacterium]|nr:protein translocase subunit SecF [Anaerolineae bacterium]
MFSLVQKRRLFFLISLAVIIPGVLIMLYSVFTTGSLFRLSNDFVGGSIYELRFTEAGADETAIRDVFQQFGNTDISIQSLGAADEHRWSVRANFQDEEVQTNILNALEAITPLDRASLRVEQVSGTVGQEVSQSAFLAVIVASVIVTGFVVIAFRQVPNAFRYGVCSIIAMVHDVLVVSGIMSLAGLLFGWEVDALFLTAVLTVLAYSVQDTIVMFDRIRENIPKHLGEPYEVIVNR